VGDAPVGVDVNIELLIEQLVPDRGGEVEGDKDPTRRRR
jgi:hypothetical protein